MNHSLRNFEESYALALKDYLAGGGEAALIRAYEIGRKAVAARLGVLEMISVHEEALGEISFNSTKAKGSKWMVKVAEFLAETLSPFEMVHRGLHETYDTLYSLNKTLKLQNEELTRLMSVLDVSLNEIYMFDADTLRFLYVNSRVLQNNGCSLEKIRTMTPLDLNPDYDEPRFRSLLLPLLENEKNELVLQTRHRRADGAVYPVEEHLQVIKRGTERVCLVVTLDLSERKQMETLKHMAYHDHLTNLPNRLLFNDRLRQAIQTSRRERLSLAIFLLDLDHFKEINDSLGHARGDAVLQQLGPRLHEVLRESDTLARLGGDEFGILLPNTDIDGAAQAARKLLEAFERPFILENQMLKIGTSIGIALFPWHGKAADILLRQADAAMYAAKHSLCGYKIYSPECIVNSKPENKEGENNERDPGWF